MTRKFVFALLLLPFFLGSLHVQAVVRNWTGASSANWSDPTNWSPAGLPAATDPLVFPGGVLQLTMTNDLPAGTTVGTMTFNDNYTLSGNALTLSGDLSFRQDANSYAIVHVTFNTGLTLANAVTFGSAANNYNGSIDVNGQTLTADESHTINSTALINGPLNGTGTVNILGPGVYITGSGTFHGTVNGTVCLTGSLPDATLNGRLTGTGSAGNTTAGQFSPGYESPWKTFGYDIAAGVLHTKSLVLTNGARFDLAPGGTSDQVLVTGTVTVAGALTVDLLSGAPVAGQTFTLIDNDGSDAVTGTFTGLPEGSTLSVGSVTFALSYHGGGGNDVVLTVVSAQKAWTGAVSGLWSNPHNWSPQVVPGGGEKLLFPSGVSQLVMTNDLPAGTAVGAMTFNDNYTLSGNELALTGDLSFHRDSFGQADVGVTFMTPLRLAAAVTFGSALNNYASPIDVNGQTLTIDESHILNATIALGALNGTGTVNITGRGIYIVGTGTFSGTINGEMNVLGSLPNATVNGRLTGTGTVGNTTVVQFSPGNESPWKTFGYDLAAGALSTKSLVLTGSTRFDLAPGSTSDQVHVTGTVTVGGALGIDLLSGAPAAGQAFTLIDNDGTDPVTGTFDGLPEGATIVVGTARFAISYHGGDGNDVALTAFTVQKSWTGAFSGNWSDARNWSPEAVPAAGEKLLFPAGVAQLAMTNDLPAGTTAGAMTFNDHYMLSGNALTLSGDLSFGLDAYGSANLNVKFLAPLKLANAVTFGSGVNDYGAVDVNGQTLTIDQSHTFNTTSVFGSFNGGGTVNIPGPGIDVIGSGNFHGTIYGSVNVSGSLPDAAVNGRLSGVGMVGNATLTQFSPGDESPWKTFGYDIMAGSLSTKSLALTGTTRFDLAPSWDEVHVTGTVTLGGSLIVDILTGAPAPGQTFTLIDNDGSDPVTGTFAGLPEGATIVIGKYTFNLTYHGGDGNDVVLINNTPPELPGAPVNLTATAGAAQATLAWQPPLTSGATPITGYRVYRQFSAGNQPLTSGGCANLGAVLTCTDTGLVTGQTYYYTVGAINSFGQGPVSNAAAVTPFAGCSLSCSATVPGTATAGTPAPFAATATPSNCGDAAPVYAWSFGDGGTSSAATPSHTYDQPGTYSWTLTTTAGGQTCSRSGTIVVSSASCQLGCSATVPDHGTAGEAIALAGSFSGSCSAVTYNWLFGDGATSPLASPQHTYDHPGSYEWELTVNGGSQTCHRSGRINIDNRCTVSCTATVSASALVSTPVSFASTANASCGAPPTSAWDFGDGTVDFLAQTTHVYRTIGSFTWHFTSRLGNGDVCTKSGTIAIAATGGTPPAVNLFIATPPEIAEGTASLLTWATSNTTSVTIDGTGDVPLTGSLRVTPHATTTYHLTASSNGVSVSVTATVIVDPPFHAEAHGAPLSGVVPFTTSLGVVASGGTPPYTYQWTTGETAQFTTHRWSAAGQYDVACTVTDSHGLTTAPPLLHVTATAPENGLALQILDQNPAYLHDAVHRGGAATDGATLLQLRATAAVPGSVTFTMNGQAGPARDGGLLPFPGTSGNLASTLTVSLAAEGHGVYSASATYKVPDDFNDGSSETLGERSISFSARLAGDESSSADIGPLSFTLVRPPLIFIHGIWSGPDPSGTWDDTWAGFPLTHDTRFTVVKAGWDGAGSIDGQKLWVGDAITSALQALQGRGIAASRADVITHSMGGLLARAWVHNGHDVIHKLITLNTPHDGSPYATWLYSLVGCGSACNAVDSLFAAAGLPIDRGAIADLTDGAASRIDAIDAPGLRTHALVGLSSLDEPCFTQRSSVLRDIQDYVGGFLGTTWSFVEQNDEVVGAASQSGGTPASEIVRGCTSVHWNVTSNSGTFGPGSTHPGLAYSDRLFQLLNSSVSGPEFGVFPRPSGVPSPGSTSAAVRATTPVAASPSADLSIASPAAGQSVAPGAVVSVWIDAPATATDVTVTAPGQFVRASGPPWVAAIHIPDTANGSYPIVAAANVAGTLSVSAAVNLTALPAGSPAGLTVDPLQLYAPLGGTAQVTVFGVYPDGFARDVTNNSGTTYVSLDPSIATVDVNGRITGHHPGMTSIKVQNGAAEATLLVTVTGGNARRRAVEH